MNVGSLFSGIGGLDHGLSRVGFRHVFLCESDPWRREVLARHFPGVPIYEDVGDVALSDEGRGSLHRAGGPAKREQGERGRERWSEAPVDLLTGGFPCQDLSVAGQRAGLAGERSGLFYEFARVAESLRPRFLLVENVPGLLSSNGGRDFGAVLGTLADIGYGLAWRILDSRYFGVPQRRRRVFVLGTLANGDPRATAERCAEILAVGTRCEWHPATRGEAGPYPAVASLSGLGSGGPDDNDGQQGRLVADPLAAHTTGGGYRNDADTANNLIAAPLSHGSNPNFNMAGRRREDDENLMPLAGPLGGGNDGIGRRSEDDPNLIAEQPVGVRRLTPTECERLQALPDGWTDFGPDSRRYAALGDAVTVSVAEWIGRRLICAGAAA